VLGLAAVFEGISWRRAAKQMRHETQRTRHSLEQYLRTPRDPTVNSGPPAASWASRGHEADRPDQPRLEADENKILIVPRSSLCAPAASLSRCSAEARRS
jgi:hypothetical protein